MQYKNLLVFALECQEIIGEEGITKAELSRRMNVSRARITQIMNLLKLPEKIKRKITAGHLTERKLRGQIK